MYDTFLTDIMLSNLTDGYNRGTFLSANEEKLRREKLRRDGGGCILSAHTWEFSQHQLCLARSTLARYF